MTKSRILVVDDEEIVCLSCDSVLSAEGHEVVTTQDPHHGLKLLEQELFDVALVDLKMPSIDGLEFLRRAKDSCPDLVVTVMTGYADVTTAVEAMKSGAFDYVPKPITPDQLAVIIGRALDARELVSENRYLRRELQAKYHFENIVGNSSAMQQVYELIERVSDSNATVLIQGESGTGKELIARAIHFNSPRKDRRFVAVDCGALHANLLESELFGHVKGAFTGAVTTKKGLFEVADGGTLFLDEISNTSLALQSKLLRVIQERVFVPVGDTKEYHTDIRLIAATNADLVAEVARGTFREDLFYRLNIVPIHLPPLRERREDIPDLVQFFLRKHRKRETDEPLAISAETLSLLVDYDWPGNVRQLENVVQRAVILARGTTIEPELLPAEIRSSSVCLRHEVPKTSDQLKEQKKILRQRSVEEIERLFTLEALRRNDWNVTRAAADVGMQRPNFQALMRKYHIRSQQSDSDSEA